VPRRVLFGLLVVALGVGLLGAVPAGAGWQADRSPAATPLAGPPGIASRIFAAATPAAVADPELALGRVVVDPGATIPPHEHPGTQLATIASGDLTYTVLTGEVVVVAADGWRRSVPAGETVVLRPGDAVIEQPGALHTARNEGGAPVVIILATLFPAGAPRAIYQSSATPAP